MLLGRWSLAFAFLAGGGGALMRLADNDCGCEVLQETPPTPTAQPVVHDPMIAKDGKKYVLFATGRGVSMRLSDDRKVWSPETNVFETPPEWAGKTIVGFRDHIWAPDVSKFGGKWHLYYSISTFGKNRSAIGHATNATLDPSRKEYKWVDEGPVVQSYPTDDYNAIDPNVVLDAKGTPWLSFGSFWAGLRLVRLDKAGHLAAPETKPLRIAQRPEPPDAIEAPFIARHGGFYYLFASYDFCCRGANSTYNVRVGRSKEIQGPYLDREGKAMTEGGGTKVVEGGTRWKGTGHQAVLRDGRDDYLIYHAYDAEDRGAPKLHVTKIAWDREGWPSVPKPD